MWRPPVGSLFTLARWGVRGGGEEGPRGAESLLFGCRRGRERALTEKLKWVGCCSLVGVGKLRVGPVS